MTAFLDSCKPGDVVYARQFNSEHGVTTTARYDGSMERVEVDEHGKERTVIDYFLWDLRKGKELKNPVAAWKTSEQYQALRSDGKIKISGDYERKRQKEETKQRIEE